MESDLRFIMGYKVLTEKIRNNTPDNLDEVVNNFEITSNSILVERFPWEWPGYATLGSQLGVERVANTRAILEKRGGASGTYGVIVYMANGKMTSLEGLRLESDQRSWCNEHGIHVCFYEPLCFYSLEDELPWKYNFGFYSEFTGIGDNPSDVRCGELDSLLQFIRNNGLTNVTVHTGDYAIEKWGEYYAKDMKLLCNDVFLHDLTYYHTHEWELKREFTRKFICTTWRYTTARHLTCAWLCGAQDHYKSWYFDNSMGFDWTGQYGYHNNMLHHDDLAVVKDRFETLDRGAPYVLDLPARRATDLIECAGHVYPRHIQEELYAHGHNPVHENLIHYRLRSYYMDSFCDLVTESRFAQPTGNISEKVFQSMLYASPFLLIAPVHSLQYMKELGFETFSHWWPEKYDNIKDNPQRLCEVLRVAQSIRNRSIEDLRVMYREMAEVLRHNWEVLVRDVTVTGRIATRHSYDVEEVSRSFAPDHGDAHKMLDVKVSKKGIRSE